MHAVAEQRPQLLQAAVKELLTPEESSKQVACVLRTCFIYFFELLGIRETEKASLDILMAHLAAKNSNTGKEKEIPVSKLNKITGCFEIERNIFMAKSKQASSHLRQFKRFCSVLATNLIDVYPAKKQYTQALVREILNFSHCINRLFRHGFTNIGLFFFN